MNLIRPCIAIFLACLSNLAFALPGCNDALFIDAIAESSWTNIDVLASQGTAGVRQALATARDQHPDRPVRIRLAAGTYADNLGAEIYAQRLQRGPENPIYLLAVDGRPNATVLGHGINLLGVSYVAIDGVTIGPQAVGAWNGTRHASPLPLAAAAGIHVAGAADNARANAATASGLDYAIYGRYQPSHHILIRRVTIQNLFEPTDLDAETSEGQGMDGMKFNQVEDLWVLDSGVTQTTRHGIDNVGVHRAAFCRNVVTRTGGGLGIEAKGGSVDVLFDSNTFYRVRRVELGGENTDAAYYFSIDQRWDYEALRVIARNNLIVDTREAALEFSGCMDCSAVDNSILFTASYVVPAEAGTVSGGDAIRVHDSRVQGTADGAGSDCQWWDPSQQDYVTIDPCWGVGSHAPAPINRVLRTDNATVVNNLFASVKGSFSADLGGSTLPCPLNVIDGTAGLHFDANFWWNGPHPLPAAGCSTLPEGPHSIVAASAPFVAPPLAANDIDGSSLASTAASAIVALTPTSGSALAGRAIANSASAPYDRVGAARDGSVGALSGSASKTGLWWNPAESGWGMSIEQQGPIMFIVMYAYDLAGQPTLYILSNCRISGASCTSDIYTVASGTAPTAPWTGHGPVSTVGTGTLNFSDNNTGVFSFTLNGVAGSKNISRMVFGAPVTPPAINHTALWWNPDESGWGIFLSHQSQTIFATWFTYDAAGNSTHYVASNCPVSGNTCTGILYKTSGGSAPTVPWVGPITATPVGSVTFTFNGDSGATMNFTIDGQPGSKTIAKMIF